MISIQIIWSHLKIIKHSSWALISEYFQTKNLTRARFLANTFRNYSPEYQHWQKHVMQLLICLHLSFHLQVQILPTFQLLLKLFSSQSVIHFCLMLPKLKTMQKTCLRLNQILHYRNQILIHCQNYNLSRLHFYIFKYCKIW